MPIQSEERPWGSWHVIDVGYGYKIKRIHVQPGKRLSLQKHQHRSEHWVVVFGIATATIDDQTVTAGPGDSVDVPVGATAPTGQRRERGAGDRRGAARALHGRGRHHPDRGRLRAVRGVGPLLADEPAPEVGLERLAHRGHVVGPEQVAVDHAVHPVAAGVLLGGLGAGDRVGGHLDPGRADLGVAVPDLHEAGVVREQPLEAAVGLGPDEAGLDGRVTDLGALVVDDPGAAHVVEERPAVVGEDALLAELELLDRRVVAVAVAAPGAQQPRDRRAVGVQVVRDLERHQMWSAWWPELLSALNSRHRTSSDTKPVSSTTSAIMVMKRASMLSESSLRGWRADSWSR